MRSFGRAVLALFALAAVGVLEAGCKPSVGDACEKGKAACQDDKTALVCQGGKYIASPCKGAKGCAVTEGNLWCDATGNAAGDVCSTDSEDEGSCTADGKHLLTCKGGKYVQSACRGPKGCKTEVKGATRTHDCDTSVAEVGDACKGEGYTCSVDGKAILKCKDGKAVLDEKCEGGGHCKSSDSKVGCEGGTAPAAASGAPAAGAASPEATLEAAIKAGETFVEELDKAKGSCPKLGAAAEAWNKAHGAEAKAAQAAADKLPKAEVKALEPKFMPRMAAFAKKTEAALKACAKVPAEKAKIDAALETLK